MARWPTSILIADSHGLCRSGLCATLIGALNAPVLFEVDCFVAVVDALQRDRDFGLLAIDIDLPGLERSGGISALRADYPDLKVVALAARADRNLVLEALKAGVHGFVPKDLSTAELSHAFRTVLSGHLYVPSMMSDRPVAHPPPVLRRDGVDEHPVLTGRQLEVVRLIAQGKSNKEIARLLSIAEGTVKVHVAAAFRLLQVHNRVSAAAAVRAMGSPPKELPLLAEGQEREAGALVVEALARPVLFEPRAVQ